LRQCTFRVNDTRKRGIACKIEPYTVNIPSEPTSVDRVLLGAGGGGGYGNGTEYNGSAGGETTASITGATEATAAGGPGGTASTTATTPSSASPGIETYHGATYSGGQGGAFRPGGPLGLTGAGQPGTAPGVGRRRPVRHRVFRRLRRWRGLLPRRHDHYHLRHRNHRHHRYRWRRWILIQHRLTRRSRHRRWRVLHTSTG